MSKIAIFVEGQTEQLFFERLLIEVAGSKNLSTELRQFTGGRSSMRVHSLIASNPVSGSKHQAYIYDSSKDTRVAQDVKDQYPTLVSSGFDAIIAVRDVYPNPITDLPALRGLAGVGLAVTSITPLYVFAVMECEAWFIAEYSHFAKIHRRLTLQKGDCGSGQGPVQRRHAATPQSSNGTQ